MDGYRVAEVWADFVGGRQERGSGFLLRSNVLVTAWHVVAEAERVRAVFQAGSPRQYTAVMRSDAVRLGESDVALAVLDDVGEDVVPVGVGRFGDRAAVIDAVAFGFPRFKTRNSDGTDPRPDDGKAKFRVLAQVPVVLAPQANWRIGRCELMATPPAMDEEAGRSPWEGMSGGPVFDPVTGLFVAVVTDQHGPEGLGRLAAVRLDQCLAKLSAGEQARVLPLLGLGLLADMALVRGEPGDLQRSAYRQVVCDIAPQYGLLKRDIELAALAQFCAGLDNYVYWQAPAKAGKTALMASFALDPPVGVTVVAFFVTARLAGQSDSAAFVDTMLDQLAALLGEPVMAVATPLARHGYWRSLLERAAQRCASAGGPTGGVGRRAG